MRLILCGLIATTLFAAAFQVELLHSNGVALCSDREDRTVGCTSVQIQSRTLKITANPGQNISAYAIDILVPDNKPGQARRIALIVRRNDVRYGNVGEIKQYATFFTLPIEDDIPILEIWVNALTWDDDGFHSTTIEVK